MGGFRHLARLLRHPHWVLAGILWAPMAWAQESEAEAPGEVPEVPPLRERFERQLGAAFLPQERRYLEELAKLEVQLAAAGDYRAAQSVKEEAALVEGRIDAVTIRLDLPAGEAAPSSESAGLAEAEQAVITLLPSTATLEGGARYSAEEDVIAGLIEEGASAEWQLTDIKPGGYEVRLTINPATGGGGLVRIAEAFFYVEAEIPPAGETSATSILLGTLRIRSSDTPLKLVAQTVTNRNLMTLRKIELIPAFSPTP